MSHLIRLAGLALLIGAGACEAGPSAFDRSSAAADSSAAVDSAALVASDSAGANVAGGPDTAAAPDSGAEAVTNTADLQGAADSTLSAGADPAGAVTGVRFPRPDAVRGLYLNAWASGSRGRLEDLISIAKRTEINSFVIDIKDATGYLSHDSEIPLAREIGATGEIRIRDLPGLLDRLEAEGIYPIARIVIVKDPLITASRPDWSVQDTAGGVWVDSKQIVWLNAYDERVWEYHVDIAREVAEIGFPEIQWDYVRFPDAPESDMARAVFPGEDGRSRPEALRGFFEYAGARLDSAGVVMTADVFGVTTTFSRDVGIGQLWEEFIDVVDVALPMVYPSHYWQGSFGLDAPNAHPYEVVREALEDALIRSARVPGAGTTRPWIQDFSLGEPIYEAPEVRAQIQGTYDVGIEEWILWNPGSSYTVEALEPVGGFETEPLIRVAGEIVPTSERWEWVDLPSVGPFAPEVPTAAPDTSVTPAGAVPVDSTAAGTDTVNAPIAVPPVASGGRSSGSAGSGARGGGEL